MTFYNFLNGANIALIFLTIKMFQVLNANHRTIKFLARIDIVMLHTII